jgi:hypothetical protein
MAGLTFSTSASSFSKTLFLSAETFCTAAPALAAAARASSRLIIDLLLF